MIWTIVSSFAAVHYNWWCMSIFHAAAAKFLGTSHTTRPQYPAGAVGTLGFYSHRADTTRAAFSIVMGLRNCISHFLAMVHHRRCTGIFWALQSRAPYSGDPCDHILVWNDCSEYLPFFASLCLVRSRIYVHNPRKHVQGDFCDVHVRDEFPRCVTYVVFYLLQYSKSRCRLASTSY